MSATDGAHVTGLGPGKPLALLAYLAVRGEARRDELVDLLWGEVSEANARNAFRQALHRLRTALGDEILPMDRDPVELNAAAGLATDRDAFVEAIEAGNIGAALESYRGDFLEGFELGEPVFDSWVEAERTRLKGRFQLALQRGAEAALGAGRWLEALQYVQRLTTVAPYDESAALLEANVLVAAGRRAEALLALRRFAQTLREQLDIEASARVRDMLGRLERAEVARDSSPSPRAKEAPFVGRELEIASLMAFARGMASEQGGTVAIEGPAGIGKSRLVSEFLVRARGLGPLLALRGRERPTSAALPYASIAEALRAAVNAPGVAGTGRHLLSEAARILPELRDSFDLPEPPSIDAEGGRLRFFEGIAALLDSAAYEQPVCLVLDDMQHASASTIDLVGYLSARLRASPVLIILIHREVEPSSPVRRLLDVDHPSESGAHAIRVGPLDRDATLQLVKHIVAAASEAGRVDVDRVVEAAAGNPLRAIELGRRALNGELPSAAPVALRDILWSRLQKASPSQRRVFFAAALLQRRCSLRLLASAAHLPELATYEASHALEQIGLLAPEGDSYVIAHDFTSTFVGEMSGLAGRALLAGWAADALAGEPAPPADELANLYAIAGQQGAAFTHARRAVYQAAALGSPTEVHRLLGFALAIAPDDTARSQVEGMLAAFGAGRKLLEAAAPSAPPAGEQQTAGPPQNGEPAPSAATPASPRAPGATRRRRIVTPRLAAIVIIGVMAIALGVAYRNSVTESGGARTLRDSLVVVERGNPAGNSLFIVTGSIDDAAERDLDLATPSSLPEWTRSLELPWIRPSVSPSGLVAVERMTEAGTDIYLMNGSPTATTPVAIGGGTDAILGWSPDGATLLVRRSRTLPDGSFDADLWAYQIDRGRASRASPIDTAIGRSVEEEAAWSPDGSRIAWVAQTGPTQQRDVFVSYADGSEVVNVSAAPGEDYHLSWSPDGHLLAFTSDRDGNPDLFAVEFDAQARRLWRLTRTPGEEDFASFSPDRRFVAYQSTASGDAAVYVMPSLGGLSARVTPPGGQFSISGWRGRPATGYVDRFRIIGPSVAARGDTVMLSVFGADRDGNPSLPDRLDVRLADSSVGATLVPKSAGRGYALVPHRDGAVAVIASIPGWREDTLTVQVGPARASALSDDFTRGIDPMRWTVLGTPRPVARTVNGVGALLPQADLQWQSGLLGRSLVSARDSVEIEATFVAPFNERAIAGASLMMALVDAAVTIDSVAPQVAPFVAVSWDGEAGRIAYSVGAQSKSDLVSAFSAATDHQMRIVISRAGAVTFFVDGHLRWTSSLRFLGADHDGQGRVWLGGKATGDWGAIRDFRISQR